MVKSNKTSGQIWIDIESTRTDEGFIFTSYYA